MIERKIWKGDVLRLESGSAFWCDQVVEMVPGYATAWQDSESDDPLVEIDGVRYIVQHKNLYELNDAEVRTARAATAIQYAGLNGATDEEIIESKRVLRGESW